MFSVYWEEQTVIFIIIHLEARGSLRMPANVVWFTLHKQETHIFTRFIVERLHSVTWVRVLLGPMN